MEDLAFKYPKLILRGLLIGAMLVAIVWGVITWDSKKAMDLWTAEVTFITTPIFNYFTNRAERLVGTVLESAFDQIKPVDSAE